MKSTVLVVTGRTGWEWTWFHSLFHELNFNNILNNAESLGYTNKDDACVYALSGGGFNPECNFETFVFFDEIHPTAVTHERAAEDLLEVAQ